MRLTGALVTHYHPDHVGGIDHGPRHRRRAPSCRPAPVPVHVQPTRREWVTGDRRRRADWSPTTAATSYGRARSRSSSSTRPATPRAASASSSTAASSPATRCSSRAAAAPTCPAAIPRRCTSRSPSGWPGARRHRAVPRPSVLAEAGGPDGRGAGHELRLPLQDARAVEDLHEHVGPPSVRRGAFSGIRWKTVRGLRGDASGGGTATEAVGRRARWVGASTAGGR